MKSLKVFLFCLLASLPLRGEVLLDVNDVSYLWPVPLNKQDIDQLAKLSLVMPPNIFDSFLSALDREGIKSAAALELWKIVSLRIDPASPAGVQEIRLVAQPVQKLENSIEFIDESMHLIFEAGNPTVFTDLIKMIYAIKKENLSSGISTNGIPLKPHPGFSNPNFRQHLNEIIQLAISQFKLKQITFSSNTEQSGKGPWVFFQGVIENNKFKMIPLPHLQNKSYAEIHVNPTAHTYTLAPNPTNFNWPTPMDLGLGPDIGDLIQNTTFQPDQPAKLSNGKLSKIYKLSDLAYVFENPRVSHRLNTDCMTCHMVNYQIERKSLFQYESVYKYLPPTNQISMTANYKNTSLTNFRMFGWFGSRPSISSRVINESAEAAFYIQSHQ